MLALSTTLSLSCAPDHPDVEASVPSRTTGIGGTSPREFNYQKEDPPPPPVDPCEADLNSARSEFASAYNKGGRPRLTFMANVLAGEVAATPSRAQDTPRLSSSADHPQDPEAVPVDRALVENELIDVFQKLAGNIRVVDLGVARGQFDRAKANGQEKDIEVLRNNNLADLAILLELRVDRGMAQSASVEVRAHSGDVHARGNLEAVRGGPITIACTARAVRVSDGAVLGTASPERIVVNDEHSLDENLRRMCFCGAAELARKLAVAFTDDFKGK